jgi:hypothetical protein
MKQKQFIYWWQSWLRSTLVSLAFIGTLGILASVAPASYASTVLEAKAPSITVYRSPECSCCGGWVKHLKSQGFKVQDFPTSEIEAVKQNYSVPNNLTSCHTAMINGYVIEGHVPAKDIKHLLQEKLKDITGLSVPGMPVGTPGMEMGDKKDPFNVVAFDDKDTVVVFNQYPSS